MRRWAGFAAPGCAADQADPDPRATDDTFPTLRAFSFAMAHEAHLPGHRVRRQDAMVRNREKGLALGAMGIAHPEMKRTALLDRMVDLPGFFDYLPCPIARVPPFPIETGRVREIDGVRIETSTDWMAACCAITVTGGPSIPMPAGFAPVGRRVVAPP